MAGGIILCCVWCSERPLLCEIFPLLLRVAVDSKYIVTDYVSMIGNSKCRSNSSLHNLMIGS